MPSKEARSAGQVGCTPEEISISADDYHFGLIQSGESWTAQCRGRTFVCSQMNETGDSDKGLGTFFGSEQISCKEMVETPEQERKRLALQAAAAAPKPQPPAPPAPPAPPRFSTPPTGAAGFGFGESAEAAQRRCRAAGNRWSAVAVGESACSGGAIDVGSSANVGLKFCDGKTCAVTIEHRPSGSWSTSVTELKAKLDAKYGIPRESDGEISEACKTEAQFAQCVDSGTLKLRYLWHWPSGELLEMTVGKGNTAASSIRLVYSRPNSALSASAL